MKEKRKRTVEFEDGVPEPSLAVAVQEGNTVSSCQLQECLDISGVLVCIREQWKLCVCVCVCGMGGRESNKMLNNVD